MTDLMVNVANTKSKQYTDTFWWSKLGENKYKHHEDTFKLTIEWLNQENYNIILEETVPVYAVVFTIGRYENSTKKFMNVIQLEFLLTDKDFAQINEARFTWKDFEIQLCNDLYLTSKEIHKTADLPCCLCIVNKSNSTSIMKIDQIQSGRENPEWTNTLILPSTTISPVNMIYLL
ncbi:hypothetical protein C1646_758544 [Rhizophagus diaphanus]|nr:hypothetical protein C1646_758544 [Rhizophagus diaphanus] [Rhizophagus sp. MUCL 43196]